jgi:uncharacterized protein (UPF0548 family)
MFVLWPRSVDDRELERIQASQLDAELTYDEVGASLGELPPGYAHGRYGADLGTAPNTFERAVDALEAWATHTGAGISVRPGHAPIEVGTVVAQRIRMGPLTSIACCRIVRVIDEPDRFGYAYGTLPLHPVKGEEAFLVTRPADAGDGEVRLDITAFSKPGHPLMRAIKPISRFTQVAVTRRYLKGVKEHIAAHQR